jgi:secreted trypsin-like serine protease
LSINGVLFGIASFRNGPACESVPGKFPNIYTDVSHFIGWIEHQTGIDYQLGMFLHGKV